MVERYLATLRLTEQEWELYRPSAGIDAIPLERRGQNNDIVDVLFVGSDLYPEQEWQKTAADIRHEVLTTLKNRVLSDNLGTHEKEPRRVLKIETFVDHPNLTSQSSGANRDLRKAAEAATEVHDVEMTKEQFEALEQPRDGRKLEPREVRRKTQRVRRVTPEGRVVVEDTGAVQELYVMGFGIVDIG